MSRLIGILLFGGSACHVAALILPFVKMRTLLHTEVYGLIPSVLMLLDFGMVGLAVLVVVFSIIFPFVKLAVLWSAWRAPDAHPKLGRLVHLAETLGKWSMLDIWLVLLLLVVTAGQTLVATEPLAGLPCFLGGVLCTMTAGSLLARRWHVEPPQPGKPAPTKRVRKVLLIAGAALLVAQVVPVLATDSLLVSDREFSLIYLAWSLGKPGTWPLCVTVSVCLIIMPWLAWIAQWWAVANSPYRPTRQALADALRRWAMLDVFILALIVFILESANAVPSVIGLGAFAMGGAVVLTAAAGWRARRMLRAE